MGESVEIRLRNSWEKYNLIPVRNDVREFFPRFKESFKLSIEDITITTYVVGRTRTTNVGKGHPTAGTFMRAGISEIANNYPGISGGQEITIEKEPEGNYRIIDW